MAKHLTYDDRLDIEKYIKLDFSLSEISRKLNRHKSTISREITLRSIFEKKGCYGHSYNACVHRYNCDLTNICKDNQCKKKHSYCKFCSSCNDNCQYFKKETCAKLKYSPYVCNNCETRRRCTLQKHYYSAKIAQKDYEKLLVESRVGIASSPDEVGLLDDIIKPLVHQGQSVHHILSNNKSTIMLCEKTIYNYIELGALSVKNIDLPRKIRYRARKKRQMSYKVDKKCLENRRYEDYLKFLNQNNDISIVQMDSVEGTKGGKVLLTIHFVDTSFMLMFLRDANNSKSVTDSFRMIYDAIGASEFKKLFPVLLTDNGSEFSDPESIEKIELKEKITNVFYCHPYSSYEKPEVENNHELIRRVIPKGKSMNNLEQEDINLLMSHVNSYTRKKLNDQSPFDSFSSRYGFKLINELKITKIQPNDVILKPYLLK
jgi:IS30 family transposase